MTQINSIKTALECPNCKAFYEIYLPVTKYELPQQPVQTTGAYSGPVPESGFREIPTIQPTVQQPIVQQPKQPEKPVTVEMLIQNIPDHLKPKIQILESPNYIMIKMREFIGKELFSQLNMVARAFNGKYIPEKKNQHFLIPKSKSMQASA